jgi:hypothetical protein
LGSGFHRIPLRGLLLIAFGESAHSANNNEAIEDNKENRNGREKEQEAHTDNYDQRREGTGAFRQDICAVRITYARDHEQPKDREPKREK